MEQWNFWNKRREDDLIHLFQALFNPADLDFLNKLLEIGPDELDSLLDISGEWVAVHADYSKVQKTRSDTPEELLEVLEGDGSELTTVFARAATVAAALLHRAAVRCKSTEGNVWLEHHSMSMFLQGWANGIYTKQVESRKKARVNALVRHWGDPKQAAKLQVKECWDLWRMDPQRYKSKSAFARDMLGKFEDLESQRVIERWCKEWEMEPT